jgi:hypothetical protein
VLVVHSGECTLRMRLPSMSGNAPDKQFVDVHLVEGEYGFVPPKQRCQTAIQNSRIVTLVGTIYLNRFPHSVVGDAIAMEEGLGFFTRHVMVLHETKGCIRSAYHFEVKGKGHHPTLNTEEAAAFMKELKALKRGQGKPVQSPSVAAVAAVDESESGGDDEMGDVDSDDDVDDFDVDDD